MVGLRDNLSTGIQTFKNKLTYYYSSSELSMIPDHIFFKMTGLDGGRVFLLLRSLSKTLSSTSLGKKSESESDFLRFWGGGLSSLTFGSGIGFGFG